MRKTREILRQKWVLKRSHREIARSLSKGTGTTRSATPRSPMRSATGCSTTRTESSFAGPLDERNPRSNTKPWPASLRSDHNE